MNVFRFRAVGDVERVGELVFLAFKRVNGLEDDFPVEIAGGSKYPGTRKICIEPLDCEGFSEVDEVLPRSIVECSRFLVRVKYSFSRRGERGYAVSDLYLVTAEAGEGEVVLRFKRLGGLGRTRPAYIALALEKAMSAVAGERKAYREVVIERAWS